MEDLKTVKALGEILIVLTQHDEDILLFSHASDKLSKTPPYRNTGT